MRRTPSENLGSTHDFAKQFKDLGLVVKVGDGKFKLWASPSKPENIRAQDRETTTAEMTLKELLKDLGDVGTQLDMDYTQGRVWWGNQLAVQRDMGVWKVNVP